MINPLLDLNFLKQLDLYKNKKIYAKITSLDQNNVFKEEISGRVTGGNISIDGNSSVRRTCNLSIIAQHLNILDEYWSLETQIKVEIGVNNDINSNYPDIIWFPMGVFILTNFSVSYNTTNVTIQVSGQDKMCKLNGTIGGTISSSGEFSSIIEEEETIKLPVSEIIRELLHEYGKEPYHNLIISDIPTPKEFTSIDIENGVDYIQKQDDKYYIYLYHLRDDDDDTDSYTLINLKEDKFVWVDSIFTGKDTIFFLPKNESDYEDLDEKDVFELVEKNEGTDIIESFGQYFQKTTKDDSISSQNYWRRTHYPPNFIIPVKPYRVPADEFQEGVYETENKEYENAAKFHKIIKTIFGVEVESLYEGTIVKLEIFPDKPYQYFAGEIIYPDKLMANIGDNVVSILDKIKNFLGNYEYFYNINGEFIFQKKRTFLNENFSYNNLDQNTNIYDYTNKEYGYSFENLDQIVSLSKAPQINSIKNDFCIWGTKTDGGISIPIHMRYSLNKKPTVYCSYPKIDTKTKTIMVTYFTTAIDESTEAPEEKIKEIVKNFFKVATEEINFTVESKCDWRRLIFEMSQDYKQYGTYQKDDTDIEENFSLILRLLNPDLCNEEGLTGYENYYQDLDGFWENMIIDKESQQLRKEPDKFWFDFLDLDYFQNSVLDKFSVEKIGMRSQVKNDEKVKYIKSIKIQDNVGDYVFVNKFLPEFQSVYKQIKVPNDDIQKFLKLNAFVSYGKDAETWINDAIYNNTLIAETITLNTIPIYYLEPNTLINISINNADLDGDYIINKISYNFQYNGTMTISAIKKQPYIS